MAQAVRACIITATLHSVLCTEFTETDPAFQAFTDNEFNTQWHFGSAGASWDQLGKDDVVILWWTGRLRDHINGLQRLTCPESKCYITTDRSKYLTSKRIRGFIFYGSDIELSDMPLPRLPHHEWALLHEESPFNNYALVHGQMIRLFNYTATFRRGSDFPLTTQHIPSLNYLLDRKPIPVSEKNKLKETKKLAPVLYVQSHCDVPSDRDRYVQKLDRYIQVDSLGKCINNKEIPKSIRNPIASMHSEEFIDLIAQYKFVLAFENAICQDYMTEKLFRVLHAGSVPVYRGSPSARDYMPDSHSIIMADDFESPEKLADFLYKLDQDDAAYEAYLAYKTQGITNEFLLEQMMHRGWKSAAHPEFRDMIAGYECFLCDRLTERLDTEQIHEENSNFPLQPPHFARIDHLQCPQPYTSFGHPEDYKKSDKCVKLFCQFYYTKVKKYNFTFL